MTITRDEAGEILARWQPILRLADWDIDLRLVTAPWRKSGDIKVDLDDRKAVLLLNGAQPAEHLGGGTSSTSWSTCGSMPSTRCSCSCLTRSTARTPMSPGAPSPRRSS